MARAEARMSVDVLATFAPHQRGCRWRCALCPAFGFSPDEPTSTDDYERHYAAAHRPKETE